MILPMFDARFKKQSNADRKREGSHKKTQSAQGGTPITTAGLLPAKNGVFSELKLSD